MISPRERFIQIAHFERPNDPWIFGLALWKETRYRWARERLPPDTTPSTFLIGGLDRRATLQVGASVSGMGIQEDGAMYRPALDPFYESEILADDGIFVTKRETDGSVIRYNKTNPGAMPQWLSYPVEDRQDWERYKQRLDPHSPGRWPDGWDRMPDGRPWSQRDVALSVNCLSLYGSARSYYMGLENLSFAMYDDPLLVEDIIEWQCTLGCEMLKKIFTAGITIDVANIFEDMCCKHGPLVSPRFVREVMVPRYRRVVELLRDNGVEIIYLDSDGNIDELLPIWLDCGINAFYPFEVAAGMDTVAVRKQYGKNVIICGNIDKRALAQGKQAIDRELARCKFLLASGGFFPSCDHHIPPDVPLDNMVYFVNELRKLSAYPETRRIVTL